MREGNVFQGPILGGVNHKTAKVWFYGTFSKDGEGFQNPYCHVFDKDKTGAIPHSPFEFVDVSKTPHETNGFLGKAFVAEITFPTEGEEFCIGINYDNAEIDTTELKYTVKRSPDRGDIDFSFGLISCHKGLDSVASYRKVVGKMWDFLYDKMSEKKSAFLIQSGDQVYCDNRKKNAWKKCVKMIDRYDHQKMLDLYRDVYLDAWGFLSVQRVMRTFPQYMIWDDHDITNGWGSRKKHRRDYLKIFEAARAAYVEFQDSHNPASLRNGELYYAFHYGNAAILVMDIRGHRGENLEANRYPLVGKEQWEDIQNWFENDWVKESKVLFVVSSVPVVHLSRRLGSLGFLKSDIADQWSTERNKNERRRLLKMLLDWSGEKNKPVFIIGGDVHVGTELCLKEERTGKNIYQITSSPITSMPAWFLDFLQAVFSSRLAFNLEAYDKENKSRMSGRIIRRHRRRNFAIIEVHYRNGKPEVKLNMYREGKKSLQTNDLICKCKDVWEKRRKAG